MPMAPATSSSSICAGLSLASRSGSSAEFGASLAEPQSIEKPGSHPGLAGVVNYVLIGDWSGNPVEVVLSGIELVPPNETLRAGRQKLRELQAQEAEQARQEAEAKEQARRQLLEAGARIRPTVLRCSTFAPWRPM